MKITTNIIFGLLMLLAIAGLFYFGWVWYKNDSSGEALFAIISAIIIPSLIYGRNKLIASFSSSENQKLIDVNITRKSVRCLKEHVEYSVQIDLEVFAIEKVSLKNITLTLKEPIGWSRDFRDVSGLPKLINIKKDMLDISPDEFLNTVESSEKLTSYPFIIEKSEHLLLTFTGLVDGERLPDGWEGICLDNWKLEIEYNDDKTFNEIFSLVPHKNTIKVPSEYKNVGFVNA